MKKILIVDDEPEIVDVLSARLETQGYEIVTGSNGEEALQKAKEQSPDLIICDVMMPPPNGFQVCRTIKDDPELKDIPVILLTAKAAESDKFWGTESRADEYITKPYNSDELLSKVKNLLG